MNKKRKQTNLHATELTPATPPERQPTWPIYEAVCGQGLLPARNERDIVVPFLPASIVPNRGSHER